MQLLLSIFISFAFLASAVFGVTQNHPYEFSSVAVIGGGYITGILAHPGEPDLMYVRTDIGSSYRWNTTLNKWIPLTDFISEANSNLLGTESIALDPKNPSRLYLAQGRYLTSNDSAFFVSSDYGQSFDIYSAPFPMGSNELGRNNGERLAVNPFNGNELWMGTRTEGLWKSDDRAKTWTNVTSFPNAFANTIGIVFVLFDFNKEGTIYAGATAPEGLFYSTDSGSTWAPIPGQPRNWDTITVPPNATKPQSSAPQPMKAALASNGVLYVTFGDSPGPYGVDYGVVFSYDTNSKVWKDITPNVTNTYPPPYEPQAFPPGGYCGLSISAHDPNMIVITSLDRDPGPALDSMYFSQDGGSSWKDVSQLSTPNRKDVDGFWGHPIAEAALENGTSVPWLSFDWSPRWGGYGAPSPIHGLAKFGWWMSAVLMSPWDEDKVMYGTGATIWATKDLVKTIESNEFPQWYVQAQGIEETVNLAMASPTWGDAHLFSGFGDINGMRHPDLNVPQPMFNLPVFSNLNGLDWAGKKEGTIVRVGVNGLNNTAESGCHQGAYSLDGGIEWKTFATCIPGINSSTTNSGTIAIDSSGQHVVWTTTDTPLEGDNPVTNISGPYCSSDWGATWTSPTGLNIQTPNVTSDKVREGTFYSFTFGRWYYSFDGGNSYRSSSATDVGLPETSNTGAVPVVDFDKAGYIYLPLGSQGIYFSVDFGSNWRKITKDGVNPTLFTIGAKAPGAHHPSLFIWGEIDRSSVTALYRSDDNGGSWVRVNDDMHQYGGLGLIQGDPRMYGRVFMGTAGRGIVTAEIAKNVMGNQDVPGTGGI
ncbi:glycoside hydrolase family 74 protein [Acidomyces richmondensis BFW]|nr:glycoside hydrolase family 74 protein [Acidomyces richmondensis BFW]